MNNVAIVLLAGGASTRLGRPKQLLSSGRKSLIQHICDEAIASEAGRVIVVTGAYHDEITNEIADKELELVRNEDWESGMASSLKLGFQKAIEEDSISHVLLSVTDQPHLVKGVFQEIQKYAMTPQIVACKYGNGIVGVPAMFPREFANVISELEGDQGAKVVVMKNLSSLVIVPFEKGNVDIDTPEDLKGLPLS